MEDVLKPLGEAAGTLLAADQPDPVVSSFKKDLYCLVRSDMMICDLSVLSAGEQGHDILIAQAAQIPTLGVTDRFQIPPSLLSRLTVLAAPSTTSHIVHLVRMFLGDTEQERGGKSASVAAPAEEAKKPPGRVNPAWVESVLASAQSAQHSPVTEEPTDVDTGVKSEVQGTGEASTLP
jgi:hypothetical protein